MPGFCCTGFSGAQIEALDNILQDGSLDKLILMDCILGSDRGPLDFLISYEAPYFALVSNDSWGKANTPTKSKFFNLIQNQALHPQAVMWLQGLDEKGLEKALKGFKTETRITQDCVARLTTLKEALNGRDCGNAGNFFKTIESFNLNSIIAPGTSDPNQAQNAM
jgi:hypothetical protein